MFTWRHILWLAICAAIIIMLVKSFDRIKPKLTQVLKTALITAAASELVKVFSTIQLLPSADGTLIGPYIPMNHLPLHFCSIQILLIAYSLFTENVKNREKVFAFMAPTCVIGGLLALAMPSIFTTTIPVEEAFIRPVSYQFFIFHAMLVALGLIITRSQEIEWKFSHYTSSLMLVYLLGFISIYLNSLLASPAYVNGRLISVDFWTNFFFTYQNPLNIPMRELWQWYLYLLLMVVSAAILLFLFYYPLIKKKGSNKKVTVS